jgi:chemotaxis methyl-accepting protein methylase
VDRRLRDRRRSVFLPCLAEHTWDVDGAPSVQLFATDIDTEAIATAREGFTR